VHQLGIGFFLEDGLDVWKEGMDRKVEWVYERQVGDISYRYREEMI